MTPAQAEALKPRLWASGNTAWKLGQHTMRRRVYDDIRSNWGVNPYVLLAHRNFSKSSIAMTIADEECRRHPGQTWAVILKTKDHASKVIRAIMGYILQSCPQSLRPKPLKSDFAWLYPDTNSQVLFFGADHDHIETARGMGFNGAIFDEAGHQNNLHDNLHSIILPALAKKGSGQVLLPSTPSKQPGHYFESLCEQAKAQGRYFEVKASQNPDVSDEWRAARAAECGGIDSIDYRVEYECEFVADPLTTVLPEVVESRIRGTDGRPALVQPVAVNMLREWYRSMDIGGKDLTAVLWGYYEPETDSVHIAREHVQHNAAGPELARGIRLTEQALWPIGRPQYLEGWADNNSLCFLYELDTGYKIHFRPTRKDEKIAQLSSLRRMIADGKLILDPSCKLTLATFKKAQWAEGVSSRGFARTPEIGHADLLDAALYLVRNVRRRPYPVMTPTFEQQIGIPGARSPFRSRGMEKLHDAMSSEGWQDEESAA